MTKIKIILAQYLVRLATLLLPKHIRAVTYAYESLIDQYSNSDYFKDNKFGVMIIPWSIGNSMDQSCAILMSEQLSEEAKRIKNDLTDV